MGTRKSRLFISFGLSLGLLILALGVLQGAVPQIVVGLAVLASLPAIALAGHLRHHRWRARIVWNELRTSARLRWPRLHHGWLLWHPVLRRSGAGGRRSPYGLAYRLLCVLVIAGMLVGVLPPPGSASAASSQPMRLQAPPEQPATQPDGRPNRLLPQRPNQPPGTFWADLDSDRDVDEADLQQIALFWNCATGDPCYDAAFDYNSDGIIDAHDMAYVGNEYDVTPPEVTVTGPEDGAVVGGATVNVTGVIADKHAVNVTVNGVAATLSSPLLAGEGSGVRSFSASVPVTSGNQALHVLATDELGQVSISSRLVGVDTDGPMIQVHTPENAQSVYTLRPTIAMSYTDFYMAVDVATLQVTLTDAGGTATNVTADLTAGPDGASGQVSFDLTEDTVYILTVSVADTLGNPGTYRAAFYVPTDPDTITPPAEPENAGWVSGYIYDSSTCDQYLIECQGLAGVRVTLEKINETALAQARAERTKQLAADPDAIRNTQHASRFTSSISGTVVTGPDGFFAFPVGETGRYALRAEKPGYTYAQRIVEIVRRQSAPVNEIYVTPIDPAVTTCDENGCFHVSADGQMQVLIPPGAIPPGQQVEVTATEYDRVNFLPSGELPPGTWETYAFNLGGDSTITFTVPITVSIRNSRNFPPGTEIPVGFWNQELLQWEHEGFAVVDPTGQWAVMQVQHFSVFDPNMPVTLVEADLEVEDMTEKDQEECASDDCLSEVALRSGNLRQEVTLPSVQVLGEPMALSFKYDSGRVKTSELIAANLSLENSLASSSRSGYGWLSVELFLPGQKTARFTFRTDDPSDPNDRNRRAGPRSYNYGQFRYLWDGRDGQGNRLPPGTYPYALRVSVPYLACYYYTLNNRFGGPPDYRRPTRICIPVTRSYWHYGTVTLDAYLNSPVGRGWPQHLEPGGPFGMGWSLVGQQFLYEDEAGHILIDDSDNNLTQYYFPARNLLLEGAQSGALALHETTGLHGMYVPEVAESLESQVPGPESQVPGPGSEVRSARSEIRSPGSEVESSDSAPANAPMAPPLDHLPVTPASGTPSAKYDNESRGLIEPTVLNSVDPSDSMSYFGTLKPTAFKRETTVEPTPAKPPDEPVSLPVEPALPVHPVRYEVTPLSVNVSGVITQPTTWTAANSPYILIGDVTVNPGVTLAVEPGVVVKGQGGTELKVLGHLDAVGTVTQPITFTSATNTGPYQ